MNINICISELRQNLSKDYDEYKIIFEKLRELLMSEIENNPKNIDAVCLIAMVEYELRKDIEISIKYLEEAHIRFADEISNEEFSMLITNLAYFYIEECSDKEHITTDLLKQAMKLNPPYAETYFALAILYYRDNNYLEALPLFKKAHMLSSQLLYKYNYSICLYQCQFFEEAISLLEGVTSNWKVNSQSAMAYLLLGNIYAMRNNIKSARQIAFDLLTIDYFSFNIEHFQLAELMFCIEEYAQCKLLYDQENPYELTNWLGQYFYCLKDMNEEDQAKYKLNEIVNEIKSNILEEKNDPSDYWTQEELDEYIQSEYKRSSEIQECYENVFYDNQKPQVDFDPELLYICYYINCPRHAIEIRSF